MLDGNNIAMPLDSDYSIALASTDPCYAVYGTSSVTNMPGNDYMIVMMAFLSGYDFRPYFDLRGIAYSTLAETKCWLTLPLVFLSQLIDYPPASIFGTGFKKVKIDGVSPWPCTNSLQSLVLVVQCI